MRVFTSDDRVTRRAGYLYLSSASGLIYDALRFVQTEADTMRAEDWARKRTDEMFATRRLLLQSIVIVVALATSSPGRAQPIVATVYGEAITTLDIEKRTKFTEMATNKVPSRQQVIDELTREKLKVREAKKHGLKLSNEEVDLVYENFARRLRNTPERLTQNLARAGSSADTVKHRIRADLADKYMRARYPRGDFWMPHDSVPGCRVCGQTGDFGWPRDYQPLR